MIDQQDRPVDADADLMLRVRSGDMAAFDALTIRHRRHVIAVITHLMGNNYQSEDLAQDVFLRVFRARHSYVVSAKFTTWLFKIVNRVVANARRALATRRKVVLDNGHDSRRNCRYYVGIRVDPETPYEAAIRRESQHVIRRAIASLNERQQIALALCYFRGWSLAEVAARLNTSQDAIKSLLHRARRNLHESLGTFLEDERLSA